MSALGVRVASRHPAPVTLRLPDDTPTEEVPVKPQDNQYAQYDQWGPRVPTPPSKPQRKKMSVTKKVALASAGTLVFVLGLGAALSGGDEDPASTPAQITETEAGAETEAEVEAEAPATPAEETEEEPVKEEPEYTVSQENAIRSAESYLDLMGFSRDGLIDQLSSEYGDGFSKADAIFAVDHVEVDWNAEAVEAGESYLELTGFSRAGLIDQLSSEYGDQFTLEQATYAADKLGL
jgi:hypothetical protein